MPPILAWRNAFFEDVSEFFGVLETVRRVKVVGLLTGGQDDVNSCFFERVVLQLKVSTYASPFPPLRQPDNQEVNQQADIDPHATVEEDLVSVAARLDHQDTAHDEDRSQR